MTPDDVRQLTKTVSAVTLAWEEQRYADCQRLLDGYWGQFLFAERDPAATVAEEAKPQAAAKSRRIFKR